MWRELDFSLRNLYHVVKIWLFTTKFTPCGENWNFLQNLHGEKVFTTNLHYVVKIPVFTTNTPRGENFHNKFTPHGENFHIFTPHGENCSFQYKFTLRGENSSFHYKFTPRGVVKIFTTYLHHVVKIFTTKFSPHVVKMAVFTTFTLRGENFHYKIYTTCGENSNIYTTCSEKLSHFHHIIYTTCGENYTVKSKIGLTSLMSGVQLKIFQVVVKIIISCHLVLKNFIWYQCCL